MAPIIRRSRSSRVDLHDGSQAELEVFPEVASHEAPLICRVTHRPHRRQAASLVIEVQENGATKVGMVGFDAHVAEFSDLDVLNNLVSIARGTVADCAAMYGTDRSNRRPAGFTLCRRK